MNAYFSIKSECWLNKMNYWSIGKEKIDLCDAEM